MRTTASNPRPSILDISYITADEPLAGRSPSAPAAGCCASTGCAWPDGEPMSIDTTLLSARRFPGLRKRAGACILPVRDAGHRLQRAAAEAEETIETVLATPVRRAGAGRRRRPADAAATRHAFDADGNPVEWAQSLYRGDRYKFVTRLRRP